ncbi:MAG: proton-conducting transporter membrane subunit [Candidatus Methylomirabilia bacterium]
MLEDHLPALLPVIPLLGALLLPAVGLVRRGLVYPLAVAAQAATAGLSLLALRQVLVSGAVSYHVGGWAPPWGIELVVDHLSAFTAVVVSGVGTLALLYAGPVAAREMRGREGAFFGLALLLLASLMGMIVTGDLFNLFVFLEVASIAGYALVASGEGPALLAAFRYIVLGTAGASLYLLGVGHLYLITGSLNMADLSHRLPDLASSPVLAVAVGFMVIGLGIKMGLFPLHGWLPDAYTHAPAAVTALIAPVTTKVAVYALARILFSVLGAPDALAQVPLMTVLAWTGGVAIIAGGVMAIRQHDFRRLLAYSSVSQMGYIVLGIGIANRPALAGAYLHILNHAMMKGCLFFAAGAAAARLGGTTLSDLRFMFRRMPLTTACVVVAALSMIGIPPAGGFFSKWYLLLGAVQGGHQGLAAVILAGSLLAAVYMFRLLEHACLTPPEGEGHAAAADIPERSEAPLGVLVSLILLGIGILAVGIWSEPIVSGVLWFASPLGLP